MKINVQALVQASLDAVWRAWSNPKSSSTGARPRLIDAPPPSSVLSKLGVERSSGPGARARTVMCGALLWAAAASAVAQIWPFPTAKRQPAPQGPAIRIGFSEDQASNAERGAFYLAANDTRAPLSAQVHGVCAPLMQVKVQVVDTPQYNLDAYLASRAGRDLPIQDLLLAVRDALQGRCPQLQVLRVNLESALRANKYAYEGTMSKAQGWALQDGHQATEHDGQVRVQLRFNEFFGRVRVDHDGRCEENPRLLLQTNHADMQRRDLSTLPDFTSLAKSVAIRYAQQCRGVKALWLAMHPMPRDHRCKGEGDCFLEARLAGGQWEVSTEQLMPRRRDNPIKDVDDMAEVLAAGAFDVMKHHSTYFNYFVASWFEAYAAQCGAHIQDPVGRSTRWRDVKKDQMGNVISEEVTETKPIRVERAHAWAYDLTIDAAGAYILQVLMANQFAGMAQQFRSLSGALLGTRGDLGRLLGGQCTSERVLTIQQNMLNRLGNQPPITGRYRTEKKPMEDFDDTLGSAPQFEQAYLKQRQEFAQQIRQPPAPAAETGPAPTTTTTPTTTPTGPAGGGGRSSADVQREYQEAMARLEQEYQAELKGARNPLVRVKVEAEYQWKKAQVQRDYQNKLKQVGSTP